MHEKNRLGNMILAHWRKYLPRMVAELQQQNRLDQAVKEAETRATDLLHEFLSVRKMQYSQAWELAMQECLLPEESSSTSPKSPPATSG